MTESNSPPSQPQRKIIHVDMDCFYAAIEVRENPQLKGKPVAVGGQPGTRSVIATCSYEAREFGVRSAMPVSKALRLCPDLILLSGHMSLYRDVSHSIREIFHCYTDLIEPLSLDEAYLDVTGVALCGGSATLMAQEIRQRIFEKEGLTASAGIAPNKFLAKVASDWNKPDGQFVITPNEVQAFVEDLPVRKINGVGKVTGQRLHELGIETCGDLQHLSVQELQKYFGAFGEVLFRYARGEDGREVVSTRVRKSLSVEDTFQEDLQSLEACLLEVSRLYTDLMERLSLVLGQESLLVKTMFVKLRFADFSTTTVQRHAEVVDKEGFFQLLAEAFRRKPLAVRLIGVGVRFHAPGGVQQLRLL